MRKCHRGLTQQKFSLPPFWGKWQGVTGLITSVGPRKIHSLPHIMASAGSHDAFGVLELMVA